MCDANECLVGEEVGGREEGVYHDCRDVEEPEDDAEDMLLTEAECLWVCLGCASGRRKALAVRP